MRREAVGESEAFLSFQEHLSAVAPIDRPVLLLGERGTGKELAVRKLHFLSSRWGGPFVALNCGAITPTLVTSELFGHEAGAFTGATSRRAGRFEAADGGTLFLDELDALPLDAQDKLLRAVEYGSFERVGSAHPIEVDVRIVGASNQDLRRLVAEGRFRADLLDRLAFEVLQPPPLRERHGDIPLLAERFLERFAAELGWAQAPELSEEALGALQAYPWPGNVRQLKNVVERAAYRVGDPSGRDPDEAQIRTLVFDPLPRGEEAAGAPVGEKPPGLKEAVAELERSMVAEALAKTKHNQRQAAAVLGLSYDQFRGLYRKYDF